MRWMIGAIGSQWRTPRKVVPLPPAYSLVRYLAVHAVSGLDPSQVQAGWFKLQALVIIQLHHWPLVCIYCTASFWPLPVTEC